MREPRPPKSRQQLMGIMRSRLSAHPECLGLSILIAAAANTDGKYPNWRVAFTTGSRRRVPSVAWMVASQVYTEFDFAPDDALDAAGAGSAAAGEEVRHA
jgi:hypothetical protein